MAVTATAIVMGDLKRPEITGTGFQGIFEIAFTGTTDYATGGVAVNTASLYGMNVVDEVVLLSIGPALTAGIGAAAFDRANGKVLLYTNAVSTQVANAANISSIKLYVRVKGR